MYDDAEDPSRFSDELQNAASSVSGYEVEEAYPVAYEQGMERRRADAIADSSHDASQEGRHQLGRVHSALA